MHDLDLHGVARLNHSAPQQAIRNKFQKGEQKVIAKLAIYPEQSSIWFSAKNRYKVDWGDGSCQNYESGSIANHTYQFDGIDAPIHKNGYKEVTVVIVPQNRYSLTALDFDPQASDENTVYLSTARWLRIDVSAPNICEFRLAVGKIKQTHPLLGHYSVSS